jgi:hypothetical protein
MKKIEADRAMSHNAHSLSYPIAPLPHVVNEYNVRPATRAQSYHILTK